jgi:hypothetical protein
MDKFNEDFGYRPLDDASTKSKSLGSKRKNIIRTLNVTKKDIIPKQHVQKQKGVLRISKCITL